MTFTATVLSPDADTQATVESDWKAGTGDTEKVDGDWTEAMNAMNAELSGTGWLYVLGTDGLPVLEKNQ